jgi:hypothetical protein
MTYGQIKHGSAAEIQMGFATAMDKPGRDQRSEDFGSMRSSRNIQK